MRHRKSGVKLNRNSSHRNAMFRNMVTSLFKYDKIKTTDVKAKELRKWADSMITLAKRGDLHARRQALSVMCEKDIVHKLFEDAAERFGAVAGGYTRITKIGLRAGDTAPMSIIELIAPKAKPATKKKKAEPEAKVEAKVEADVETKVEADVKADADVEAKVEADVEAKVEADVKVETESPEKE